MQQKCQSMPAEKYKVILADCPWEYRDKANAGERGACHKYPVMNLKDLMELPVDDIGDDNSELWFWGTWPQLIPALMVMFAWGYTYKTLGFDWMKLYRSGDVFMGGGSGTRSNTEFCLRGIKGKGLKRVNCGVRSAIKTIREGRHSEKPEEVRDGIVRLFGDMPRIELFARTLHPGYTSYGNDIDGRDIRDSVGELASHFRNTIPENTRRKKKKVSFIDYINRLMK